MIYYKTRDEIELIRQSCQLASKALAIAAQLIKPGVSTLELDKAAEDFVLSNGGTPAFKGYRGFPYSACVSINEEVVHGIPSASRILKEGDIVSFDFGVLMNGYYGDTAYTFAVGEIKPEVKKLMTITKEALYKGIEQAVVGRRLGDISYAIQELTEIKQGYGVVRDLVGHGVGKKLHEDPEVPNYGRRGAGIKLQEGLIIAIEPMINLGKRNVVQLSDGWTVATQDKLPSAHFEHTIAVGKDKADLLTTFKFVEEALAK
jgi:methionyl aminopeptidase